MPEERYRIVPTGGSSRDEHIVGRSKLNRWTKVERSFEPGDHVIYVPDRTRAGAEDGNMRRVVAEQWVGEVQSSYTSDHAPGDIIVKFAARLPLGTADDWNAIRWREDFRFANPEEVRRMRERLETATQVAERLERERRMRDALSRPSPGGLPTAEERSLMQQYAIHAVANLPRGTLYRAGDREFDTVNEAVQYVRTQEAIARNRPNGIMSVDLASGPDRTVVTRVVHDSIHQQVADGVGISRSVLDQLIESGHTYLNRSAAMSSLDEAMLTTLVERAERMKPVATPPTPTVIGGKRRLKL